MSTVNFFTAPGQPAFSTESATGDYAISEVIGSLAPDAREARRPYMVLRENYSRPAANSNVSLTIDGASVTAYFVGDENFQDLRGGVCTFERVYRTVPASWSEPSQYAFPYPAYSLTGSANVTPANITAVSSNANAYPTAYTLSANITGVGISAGDSVQIDLTYVLANANTHVTGVAPVVSAVANTSVTINTLLFGSGTFTSVSGTLRKQRNYRATPETIPADARILHDYALTDGTPQNVANTLPTIAGFVPAYPVSGLIATSLDTTTVPTAARWASMIDAGTEIVAEASTRDIYAGLIYERKTILVKAQ